MTLRNQEADPVTIRAYPLEWRQADGGEAYAETSAVIVSPPIFTIAPGATQLIRVGLRSPSGARQAYRLIIEEVPDASPGNGIRVALRLNLPLYAMIPAGQASAVRWSAWQEATAAGRSRRSTAAPAMSGSATKRRRRRPASAPATMSISAPSCPARRAAGASDRKLEVRDQARFRQIAGRKAVSGLKRAATRLGFGLAVLASTTALATGGGGDALRPALFEVTLNGERRTEPVLFLQGPDGALYATAATFRQWRIRAPRDAPIRFDGELYYRLSAVPVDPGPPFPADQSVAIELPATACSRPSGPASASRGPADDAPGLGRVHDL